MVEWGEGECRRVSGRSGVGLDRKGEEEECGQGKSARSGQGIRASPLREPLQPGPILPPGEDHPWRKGGGTTHDDDDHPHQRALCASCRPRAQFDANCNADTVILIVSH